MLNKLEKQNEGDEEDENEDMGSDSAIED